MDLEQILRRAIPPVPWEEGTKIPWDDPEFSRRMLREHLTQEHDLASRRAEIIDQHVTWIHQDLLRGQPGQVLDLGCGPGLYTARLAALGHDCTGIDFSPASIEYARSQPQPTNGRLAYHEGDIRSIAYGSDYDLVMFIFGELNAFTVSDAQSILSRARQSLKPDGRLLLEAHTFDFVRSMGEQPTSWRASEGGLFAVDPHLVLAEHFWHPEDRVATQRTFIVHAANAQVDRYVETIQAYCLNDYRSLLETAGFSLTGTLPAMPGLPDSNEFVVLLAEANGPQA